MAVTPGITGTSGVTEILGVGGTLGVSENKKHGVIPGGSGSRAVCCRTGAVSGLQSPVVPSSKSISSPAEQKTTTLSLWRRKHAAYLHP